MTISPEEQILHSVFPPKDVLVLGIPSQSRIEQLARLGAKRIIVVDADETQLNAFLQNKAFNNLDVSVDVCAITELGQPVSYYTASLKRESGFIPPEALRFLWQNIAATEQLDLESSMTLSQYLSRTEYNFNWLVSDRLDIGRIIRSSEDMLRAFDLMMFRTASGSQKEIIADQASVDQKLNALGFFKVSEAQDRHPKLTISIHVNDWKSRLELKLRALQENVDKEFISHAKEKESLVSQIESLTAAISRERAEIAEQLADWETEHEAETTSLTQRLEQTKSKLQASERAIESAGKEKQAIEQEMEILKNAHTDSESRLKHAHEQTQSKLENAEIELEKLTQDYQKSEQATELANKNLCELKRELEDLQAANSALTNKLRQSTEKCDALSKQKTVSDNNIAALREKHAHLSQKYVDQEQIIEEIVREIAVADAQLKHKPNATRRKSSTPKKTAPK
ncbi:MAG: hypothetical protein AAGL09_04285 [Pseudomonadota bacterium]